MRIRVLSIPFLIALLCAARASAQLIGTTYAEAQKTKAAAWAFTYFEAPSYSSKQADGSVQGLAVDIIKKFAEHVTKTQGIRISYEFKGSNSESFKKVLQEVKEGKGGVFGLGNISITETRKKEYLFSPAFIKNISLLCTNKDVPTLESLDKAATVFANFKGVVVAGSTDEMRLVEFSKKHAPTTVITRVENNEEALSLISKDKKAYTTLDFTFFFKTQKEGAPIKRHPAGDQATEDFGIIMPKSNDWATPLSSFLTEFLKSAEYKKLLLAHLGATGVQRLESFGKK